ncbi:MAG: helix-turn-helix domain-containing protein [Nakamurella sp.]
MTVPANATRIYRSPKRAQQAAATRSRILTAAARQFAESGYTASSFRMIAAEAGVSVPAVELHFHSKAQLLKAAIDVAIAGDEQPVAVLDRSWAARASRARSIRGFLAPAAGALRQGQQRSAGLILTAYEAANTDTGIREVVGQLEAGRTGTATWIVKGLTDRAPLRDDITVQAAIDIVWLLMDPVVYHRLTSTRGWTEEQYENWFTDSVLRLLQAAGTDAPPSTKENDDEYN